VSYNSLFLGAVFYSLHLPLPVIHEAVVSFAQRKVLVVSGHFYGA